MWQNALLTLFIALFKRVLDPDKYRCLLSHDDDDDDDDDDDYWFSMFRLCVIENYKFILYFNFYINLCIK